MKIYSITNLVVLILHHECYYYLHVARLLAPLNHYLPPNDQILAPPLTGNCILL